MLELGIGCKYRLTLAERFECTGTIINQLLADSYQNPISEWQVKTSSGLPLILHYGEFYNYFIIYYNVIIIEVHNKCNALDHPQTIPPIPGPWKNYLPQNWSLVPKRLGTTALKGTINRVKKQFTEREKILANYISSKGLLFTIYKEFLQLTTTNKVF